MKGILRQFSVATTPQQNEVAKKRNWTLIEAARNMLADSKLPTTFWAEPVNTACYTPNFKFCMRPFGCIVTILITIDHFGQIDGKDDGRFSKSIPNVVSSGPDWLFDIDALTRKINYKAIVAGTQSNGFEGTKASDNADPKSYQDDESKPSSDVEKKVDEDSRKKTECNDQEKEDNVNNTNNLNAASINEVNIVGTKTSIELLIDPNMHALEDYSIFDSISDDQDDGTEADMNNLETTIQVSHIPTIRIHKDHHLNQVIGDLQSATQTRNMSKNLEEYRKNPKRKRAIGTKWVFKNKKDERGIMIRNKVRLVSQGYIHEEGIDYDKVFSPVARIEAIKLFLAYDSFKDFVVYQMGVKSAFLYKKIEEEVYQKKDGIFISQDKYVGDILKKFGFIKVKSASTPMETQKPLLKDEDGEEVVVHIYRSMIGSLMYLTSSRPDIMFAVCACARYQVNLKVSHLHAMKRILRYLKGQPKLGLWYPKDSRFDLVAYTYSDYAGASLDRKSIIGEAQVDGKKIIITKSIVRRDLQLEDDEGVDCLPNVTIFKQLTLMGEYENGLGDKGLLGQGKHRYSHTMMVQDQEEVDAAVNEEMDDSLVRVATTATSLDAEQDRGSGPRRQETMGDTIAQTRSENASKLSNDPLLARGNTLRSGEDILKLEELMALCTTLQSRVLALETTKTTQATEIASLKKRVKKLERRNKLRTYGLKRLYRVGSSRTLTTTTVATTITAVSTRPKAKGLNYSAEIELVEESSKKAEAEIAHESSLKRAGEELE
ncbi:retrovirus-related pol polyprotein from transposon TNT 1-94 [Tanacetum coccineum]